MDAEFQKLRARVDKLKSSKEKFKQVAEEQLALSAEWKAKHDTLKERLDKLEKVHRELGGKCQQLEQNAQKQVNQSSSTASALVMTALGEPTLQLAWEVLWRFRADIELGSNSNAEEYAKLALECADLLQPIGKRFPEKFVQILIRLSHIFGLSDRSCGAFTSVLFLLGAPKRLGSDFLGVVLIPEFMSSTQRFIRNDISKALQQLPPLIFILKRLDKFVLCRQLIWTLVQTELSPDALACLETIQSTWGESCGEHPLDHAIHLILVDKAIRMCNIGAISPGLLKSINILVPYRHLIIAETRTRDSLGGCKIDDLIRTLLEHLPLLDISEATEAVIVLCSYKEWLWTHDHLVSSILWSRLGDSDPLVRNFCIEAIGQVCSSPAVDADPVRVVAIRKKLSSVLDKMSSLKKNAGVSEEELRTERSLRSCISRLLGGSVGERRGSEKQ